MVQKYKDDTIDLKERALPGQPNGAAKIAGVDYMIKHDAMFTVKDIVKSVGISSASVHKGFTSQIKL